MGRDSRRLAAIVALDVVGYSRLMGRDESGTLASLKAHRHDLIEPKVREHGGRIVKTTGDGLLLEFPSVVDALHCALDLQRGMANRNVDVAPDERIQFRAGINIGDVIADGDDIYGDGVNVAARLEALADPGGIFVSRVVRDQVLGRLDCAFDELGPRQMKNIAQPVEVFRARDALPGGAGSPPIVAPSRGKRRTGATLFILVAGLIGGYVVWQQMASGERARATAAATSNRPLLSFAVLPLAAASPSERDGDHARVLTQDLTAAVGRGFAGALVTANAVARQYGNAALDPRRVGDALNVRYLLLGNIRATGAARELNVELIDSSDGGRVWSARQEIAESGEASESLGKIVNGLRGAVREATVKQVASLPPDRRAAWDLMLLADKLEWSIAADRERQKLYEEALRLDPELVEAMMSLSWVLARRIENEPEYRAELVARLDDVTLRATRAAPKEPRAWIWRTFALRFLGNWGGAFAASEEALRLDPLSSAALIRHADLLIFAGRADEALAFIDRAIEISPSDRTNPTRYRCWAYLLLARDKEAAEVCEAAAALLPDWLAYMLLTAVHANLGNMERAAHWKGKLLEKNPRVTIQRIRDIRGSDNPRFLAQSERGLAGLRKAGVPEK